MIKKLKTYFGMDKNLRKSCREAFYFLALAKFLIKFIPLRFFAKYLGAKNAEPTHIETDLPQDLLRLVRKSIGIVSRNVPWQSKCLDQAMSAQWMLARRHLPGTLYLGMKKSELGQKPYDAHAWVLCNNQPVIGFHPNENYVIVGTYSLFKIKF